MLSQPAPYRRDLGDHRSDDRIPFDSVVTLDLMRADPAAPGADLPAAAVVRRPLVSLLDPRSRDAAPVLRAAKHDRRELPAQDVDPPVHREPLLGNLPFATPSDVVDEAAVDHVVELPPRCREPPFLALEPAELREQLIEVGELLGSHRGRPIGIFRGGLERGGGPAWPAFES